MKNVGEKLTDEEAEKMIKETDEQQSRSSRCLTGGMSQSDSAGAGFGTNRGNKIVEVAQIITQERVQNRTVKQIVEVFHSIPMEVEHAQMERIRGTSRRTDHRRAETTSDGGEAAQSHQDDDAEKAFTRTGKVHGEQASRRCSEGQDHQEKVQ